MLRVGATLVVTLVFSACGAGSVESGDSGLVPAGDAVNVAGWDVRTVDTRTDRSSSLASDQRPFDVRLSAWFSGNGSTTFDSDIRISADAGSGVEYRPEYNDCLGALDVDRPVSPDQSIEGFVCFLVDPGDAADLLLVLAPIEEDAEPTLLDVVEPTAEAPDGPAEVVAELAERGVDARLVSSPYARSPFLGRAKSEHVLCLDGEEAMLYEYATEGLRETDSDLILPSGGFETGHFDLLYGRVMWWAKGRVIVNYNLANPKQWDLFTAVLGEPLSPNGETYQEPPDPLPPSEACT